MRKIKPRLVFLDAGTVDYGDLSLHSLELLGNLKVHHHSSSHDVAKRLRHADIAIFNKCVLDGKTLRALPRLRCVALTATGTNNVDLAAAKKLGIAVCNVPGYSSQTVAQNALAFILALAGNLVKYNKVAQDGTWSRSPFFTYGAYPIVELEGKKLGIIGYGSIGKKVGEMARAFGMKLLVPRIPGRHYLKSQKNRISFEQMVREADFITIHTPLTDLTRDLINASVLRKMKRGAFLINMARGGIVNERALRQALRSGRLAGAATDVLTQEPPLKNHILLGAPNLLMMPHVSWASREVRVRLMDEVAKNIRVFLQGRRRNRII